MKDCPFCKIVADRPHWALDRGPEVICFKPFGAVVRSHRLFIPVRHIASGTEDPELAGRVFAEAYQWAAGRTFNGAAIAFNLVVNDGATAGQTVPHLHVHYVPRQIGDGLGYRWKKEEVT